MRARVRVVLHRGQQPTEIPPRGEVLRAAIEQRRVPFACLLPASRRLEQARVGAKQGAARAASRFAFRERPQGGVAISRPVEHQREGDRVAVLAGAARARER